MALVGADSVSAVEANLDGLVDAHLLEATATGRYWLGGLMRCYAAERARIEDSQSDR